MCNPRPAALIAIIGCTGTGKSDLAIHLAQRFNGEVINSDATQLYHGLPILTNKLPRSAQHGITHHLLDCIPLTSPPWVLGEYCSRARRIIDQISERGKLPILVGGTHYYIQSLLFSNGTEGELDAEDDGREARAHDDYTPTSALLAELQALDPVQAAKWHPNDRRKILRSLEIVRATGRPASDIYSAQTTSPVYDSLVLWPHARREPLRKRLDARVGDMLRRGLMDEVRELGRFADGRDTTRGIWIAIGFKQFFPIAREGSQDEAVLTRAVEETQFATRRYAKRQETWIRGKFWTKVNEARMRDKFFVLDSSDAQGFRDEVCGKAEGVVDAFLKGEALPQPKSLSPFAGEVLADLGTREGKGRKEGKNHCPACNVTCVVEDQWKAHLRSKRHKKLVSLALRE
ncbi:tRNA isopentenyltransferase [Piedraia hortae CBS 480.64]|uniref:tRNA dimethylallyltransferase n=1 Tax=Piedraia hortae CBS 480.64 TaxID=1314780 RepID=A0A6A7C7X2_9PEZI|nr:tRNA isopentenyltransferase [Piedraia hortae CBS 480.64]